MIGLVPERGVSRREAEVLDAVAEQLTNAEIAARLYVSERTVESHVSSLLRKFGAHNRRELARLARSLTSAAPVLPPALRLAADSGPLVGRAAEMDLLRDLWGQAATGRSVVVVVTGEAGIGKTRVIAELAAEVKRGGAKVMLGSCFEDMQTPYQPFAQAIEDDLAGLTEGELRRRIGDDLRPLGRLTPALRSSIQPTVEIVDPSVERAELIAAVCRYLSRAAGTDRLLLVIEDLHWGTATTRDALRHLARTTWQVPLLVVATSRDTPPDATDQLAILLGDLARQPSVTRLRLSGLEQQDVRTLVAVLDHRNTGLDPEALHAHTGGNPLFIRELVAEGGWVMKATSTRSLLSARATRISEADNALLDLAAVLGAEFDADRLAAAADTTLVQVLSALERAESAGLIQARPGRVGRFAFVHALFCSARYEALSSSRRLQLHLRVALVLAQKVDRDEVIAELARHACEAAPIGEPRAAIDYARRAGDLAAQSLALYEAAAHYRRALEVYDLLDPPDEALRCSLTIKLGAALTDAGDPEGRIVLELATSAARQLRDYRMLASIAWVIGQKGQAPATVDQFLFEVAQEALAGLGPEPTVDRARLLVILAAEAAARGQSLDRRLEIWNEALVVARDLNDPVTVGRVLASFQWSGWHPDNLEHRLAVVDELRTLADRHSQPVLRVRSHAHRYWNLLEVGAVAAARHEAEMIEGLVGDRQTIGRSMGIRNRRATLLFLAGDLIGAEQEASALLTVGKTLAPVSGDDPINYYGPHLMVIRFTQGRIVELVPVLQAAADINPLLVVYRAVLAMALARSGDFESARHLLLGLAPTFPRNVQWYTGMVLLADAAEIMGDVTTAALLEKELNPYSGRLAVHGVGVTYPIDIALAQLALARGHYERADEIAGKAIRASRRMDTPIFLARALTQQAAARHRLGHPSGATSAFVDEALAIARRTGAHLVEQELARYGVI